MMWDQAWMITVVMDEKGGIPANKSATATKIIIQHHVDFYTRSPQINIEACRCYENSASMPR